jgi:hypothetical protein
MRTTFKLDDDVLVVAGYWLASIGASLPQERNGLPLLPWTTKGEPVDLDLVNRLRDDAPRTPRAGPSLVCWLHWALGHMPTHPERCPAHPGAAPLSQQPGSSGCGGFSGGCLDPPSAPLLLVGSTPQQRGRAGRVQCAPVDRLLRRRPQPSKIPATFEAIVASSSLA